MRATLAAIVMAGVLGAGPSGVARAQEVDREKVLAAADGKMRRGLYADAADLYGKVKPGAGSAAAYNRACALLKTGKVEEGEAALKDVVAQASDAKVAAAGAFNLGRSLHTRSASEQDPSEKVKLLERAEGAFRACVDAAPGDMDGARALEITRREIKAIRDEMERRKKEQEQKQQQEQQKKDQEQRAQKQKLADTLKDLADKQDKAEQVTKQNEDKSESAPEQKEQAARDAADEQKGVGQQTQSAAQDLDKQRKGESGKSEAMDTASQAMKEAREEQSKAEDSLKSGDFKDAREQQKKAAERLREAAEQLEKSASEQSKEGKDQGKDQQGKGERGKQQSGDKARDGPQEGRESGEPQAEAKPKGDPLAAKLLDREEQARQARQRLIRSMRGKPTPVDKDW